AILKNMLTLESVPLCPSVTLVAHSDPLLLPSDVVGVVCPTTSHGKGVGTGLGVAVGVGAGVGVGRGVGVGVGRGVGVGAGVGPAEASTLGIYDCSHCAVGE